MIARTISFRARSTLGLPFVWAADPHSARYQVVVPTERTVLSEFPDIVAALAAVPGIESSYDAEQWYALDDLVAAARRRRAAADADARARHCDQRFFPTTIFARARRRARRSFSDDVHSLSSEWRAYEMSPETFTRMRFNPEVEIDFLDPDDAPPPTQITLRLRRPSAVGPARTRQTPACRQFGRTFTRAPQHVALYPWEIQPIVEGNDLLEFVEGASAITYGSDMPMDDPAPAPATTSFDANVQLVARYAPADVSQSDDATLVPRQNAIVPTPLASASPVDDDEKRIARLSEWAASREAHAQAMARGGLTMHEILARALGLQRGDASRALEMRVARALNAAGWEHMPQCLRDGERVRPYRPRAVPTPLLR